MRTHLTITKLHEPPQAHSAIENHRKPRVISLEGSESKR